MSLCVFLVLAGCRRSSDPGFFEAERRYRVLVAQDEDEAYLSEEMAVVEGMLRAVPSRAIERPRADALLADIKAGRDRAQAARRQQEAKATDRTGQMLDEPRAPPPSNPETPPAEPGLEADMAEELFMERFGACVSGGEPVKENGVQPGATGYTVRETEPCLKALNAVPGTTLVFVDRRFAGRLVKRTTTTVTQKPGQAEAPRAAPTEPTAKEFLVVPGAPLPPELVRQGPPPSPGTVPLGNAGPGFEPVNPESALRPREP